MSKFTKAIVPIVVAGLAFTLTACSGAASGSTTKDASGPLTVWVMGDSSKNFEKLVAPFVKSTGQKVDVVAIPWDSIDQKLTTSVASGSGPDVVQIGLTKLRSFADAGALLPLDDKISAYPNLAAAKFADGVGGKATAVNGKIVSVPWVSDTRVLFTRTDILSAAGIDSPPSTWDQLRSDAKTLAQRGPDKYGYYIPQWDNALPVEMTWDFGGSIVDKKGNIDFNTDAFHKAVDLYTGLYSDKSVPVNGDFDQVHGFVSGAAPMLVSGPYLAAAINAAAPNLAGKWTVSTLPEADKGTSLFAGSNLGIFKTSKHQNGSLKLLDFISKSSTQLEWYKINGELPTVKAALNDPSFTSDPLVKVYTKQLADAKVLPLIPNWDGGVGANLLKALNSIALQHSDPKSTLDTFYQSTAGMSAK
ncbi:extracellular solute-binding protein [Diaminobutyricibacter tongyongensis]|uniref:Extracellular solute-binding protein n=1 Tax=Leifsonia tongyongensis TaxID=1268043 RepID=A0A6L9XWW4_9MICO|nr:extracellular solute-binding protein [Diaminobutyricibacter tongyongensis]NEN05863.1 extracellular solute-binding protein [Diaminobutyricibacter tongyongensis]